MSNSVSSYIKNLGKSVVYSAVDAGKEIAPSSTSFIETNQQLFKEVYHSVRDYKTTLRRANDMLSGSKVYEAAEVGLKSVREDLMSGKFYNKERESSMMEKSSSMFNMDDMNIDMDFGDAEGGSDDGFGSLEITSGDKLISDTINKSSRESAEMLADVVIRTGEYQAKSNRAATNILFTQNARMLSDLKSGIHSVGEGVNSLVQFSTSTMQAHAENSKTFFESTSKLLQEQNAIMKEMLEMQRNEYTARQGAMTNKDKKPGKIRARFDDIVDANNMPDIKAYFNNVGGNIKSIANEHGASAIFGGEDDGNMLLNFVSNPLRIIPDILIKSMIGPEVGKISKRLDKSISGIFGTMIAKLNRASKDDEGSFFSKTFGKIFGIRDNVKSSIETGNYEKGPVPFDGVVRKTIVDVIPTHLAKIEAALTGMGERIFDHSTGKWEKGKDLKDKFDSIKRRNVNNAFSDMDESLGKAHSSVSFKTRKDKQDYYKDMQKMLDKMYDDGGGFAPNSKDEDEYLKYGVDKKHFKMFASIFNKMPKDTAMQMAGNVQNQRGRHNKEMEELENKGSIFSRLFDNSEIDKYVEKDKHGDKYKATSGIIGNNLASTKDDKGHNLFYYLQNMYLELTHLRRFGTGVGGPAAYSGRNLEITDRAGNRRSVRSPGMESLSIENKAEKTNQQRHRESEDKADDRHIQNEERRQQKAKARGKNVRLLDSGLDDKDNILNARVGYQDSMDEQELDAAIKEYEDMPWAYRMLREEADNSRKKRKETLEASRGKGSKDGKKGFINELLKAGTLGEKYAVIRDGIDNLTSSPGTMITKVLAQADQNIYDFFYGKETDVKDDNGNKINGFFDRMVYEMKGTFGKINAWLDDAILKPLKDKLGLEAIGKKFKEFFLGDEHGQGGILSPVRDSIKNVFSGAWHTTKSAVKGSYEDIRNLVNGGSEEQAAPRQKTVKEMTKEEKAKRMEEITSSYKSKISDSKLLEEHVAALVATQVKEARGPITPAQAKRRDSWKSRLTEFNNTDANHNYLKNKLTNHVDDAADITRNNVKAEKQDKLKQAKQVLGIDDSVNIRELSSKTDLNDKEKAIMALKQDPKFKELFKSIDKLEGAIPHLTTEREKLEKQVKELEEKKKKIVSGMGAGSLEELRNNRDYSGDLESELNEHDIAMRDAWSNQDEAGLATHTANKEQVQAQLDDFNRIRGVRKSGKAKKSKYNSLVGEDRTDKVQALMLERYEKQLGTKDVIGALDRHVRLGEYNLGNTTDDASKEKLKAEVEALRAKLSSATKVKSSINNKFRTRTQGIFDAANIDDKMGTSGIINSMLSGTNTNDLANIRLEDLIEHANSKGLSHITEGLTNFKTKANINRTNSAFDTNDTDTLANIHRNLTDRNANTTVLVGGATGGIFETTGAQSNHGILSNDDIDNRAETFGPIQENLKGSSSSNKALGAISSKIISKLHDIVNRLSGTLNVNIVGGGTPPVIGSHAKGARYIQKSGLTAITEGEMIIPSELNPLNPNRGNVDKDKEVANEQSIKSDFSKDLAQSISNGIRENADGSQPINPEGKPNAFMQGVGNLKSGAGEFATAIFGDGKQIKESINKVGAKVKELSPKAISGGLLGGVLGLTTGLAGPLIAAVAGSALGIASGSQKMQSWLFGDKVVNDEGEDNGRSGGVFSRDFQQSFKKYLPDLSKYGITGTLAGMLTPFGPLGGLVLGSGIAFAKNNEQVRDFLFGDEDGLINADRKKLLLDAIPNISTAILGSVLLGPFGFVGNAVLGTGIGLLSSTEEFKNFMLGEPDENGKRTGGLAGTLKTSVVDPLAEFASTFKTQLLDFINKDMIAPLKSAIAPISKDIKNVIAATFSGVGGFLDKMFENTLGIPLSVMVKDKIIDPIAKLSKGVLTMAAAPAKFLLSAPSKMIGAFGDMRRASHIKSGNADYMTADQRQEFRMKKGIKGDKMQGFDSLIANASRDNLAEIEHAMGTIKGGKDYLRSKETRAIDDLGSSVAGMTKGGIFGGETKELLKLVHAGKVEEAQKLIYTSKNLKVTEKDKLSKLIEEKGGALKTIRQHQENFSGSKDDLYKKLSDELGIKGINDKNLGKYQDLISHEKTARLASDKVDATGDDQYKAITSTLDDNSKEITSRFDQALELLKGIKDGSDVLTEEQKKANEKSNSKSESARKEYSQIDKNKIASRSGILERYYGEGTLNDTSKNMLVDNQDKFNKVKNLTKSGYKFKDINGLLGLDDNVYTRMIELAKLDYDIKDYKKIAKLSDQGYSNVLRLAKLGYKFTNFNKIAKLNEDEINHVEELLKAGYNHENMSLDNMLKLRPKQAQMLADPTKFQKAGLGLTLAESMKENGPLAQMTPNKQEDKMTQMTEDGLVELQRTSDGSMEPTKSKDNEEVAKKKQDRENTQKGILDRLTTMSTGLTGWIKTAFGMNNDKKKEDKPWWQQLLELLGVGGVIYGALQVLPNIKDAIADGKNLVVEAIKGVGQKITDVVNWLEKKFGVTGDHEESLSKRGEGAAVRAVVRSGGKLSKYVPESMSGTKKILEGTERIGGKALSYLNPGNQLKDMYAMGKNLADPAWRETAMFHYTDEAEKMGNKLLSRGRGLYEGAANSSLGKIGRGLLEDNAISDVNRAAGKLTGAAARDVGSIADAVVKQLTGSSTGDIASYASQKGRWALDATGKLTRQALGSLSPGEGVVDNITRGAKNLYGKTATTADSIKQIVTPTGLMEDASKLKGQAIEGSKNLYNRAAVTADSIKQIVTPTGLMEDASKLKGQVIEKGSAMLENLGFNGEKGFLEGLTEKAGDLVKGSNIGKAVTDLAEGDGLSAKILSGTKGFLEGLLKRIKSFLPNKQAGEGVLKLFTRIMGELGIKLAKSAKQVIKFIPGFNIIDGFAGFISGYQDVNSIFGITHGATDGMKLCTGLVRCLNNVLAFGLIPEKWIMTAVIDYVGPAVGIDTSVLQGLRKESDTEVADYNTAHGTDLSTEQYNKEVLGDKTIFEKFEDSNLVKFIKEKGSEGASVVWESVKKAGTWAYDSLSSLIGGMVDIGGFLFDVVKSQVQLSITDSDSEDFANIKEPTIKDDDPLGGMKKVLFYGIRASLLAPSLLLKMGSMLYNEMKPIGQGLLAIGSTVVTDIKTDFGLAMSGETGKLWSNDVKGDSLVSGISSAIGFIPKLLLTPMALINSVMNTVNEESNPTIDSIKGVFSSVGDSVSSMAKAAILGDWSGVFSMPDAANQDGIAGTLSTVASISTKVILAPITMALAPIGIVVSTLRSVLDKIGTSGVISEEEKARISNGDVPASELFNPSSTYWNTADNTTDGSPMSMLGWIGSKIYKLMMAPVVLIKSIFKSVGESVDTAKTWMGEKFKWIGKYFGVDNGATPDPTPVQPKGSGNKAKFGRGDDDDTTEDPLAEARKNAMARRSKAVQEQRARADSTGHSPGLTQQPTEVPKVEEVKQEVQEPTSLVQDIKEEVSTPVATTTVEPEVVSTPNETTEQTLDPLAQARQNAMDRRLKTVQNQQANADSTGHSPGLTQQNNQTKQLDEVVDPRIGTTDTKQEYISKSKEADSMQPTQESKKEVEETSLTQDLKDEVSTPVPNTTTEKEPTFYSQLDTKYDMAYNGSDDTATQTMKDSGCGPVSASNMLSTLTGQQLNPKDAAKYALDNGFKEKDGGTYPGYFNSLLGNYGVDTKYEKSQQNISNRLKNGKPVILMGSDKKADGNTPYGSSAHYIVGTGLDDKGNMIVKDPESFGPKAYNASNILNNTNLAISADSLNPNTTFQQDQNKYEADYKGAKNVDYSKVSDSSLETDPSKYVDGRDTTSEYINGVSAKSLEYNRRMIERTKDMNAITPANGQDINSNASDFNKLQNGDSSELVQAKLAAQQSEMSGTGKFGRGKTPIFGKGIFEGGTLQSIKNRIATPVFGRGGGSPTSEKMWAIANWVSQKIGMKPEFAFGQWYHESGGFGSQLARENYNFGGMTQSTPNGAENKQPDGSNYYMQFDSPEQWGEYYAKYINKLDNPDAVKKATNVAEFAQALKNEGYYGASVGEYINGVSAGISNIPGNYDKTLVDASKLGQTANNKGATKAAKKYGGLFGALDAVTDSVSSEMKKMMFGEDSSADSNGTTGSNKGSMTTDNTANGAGDWMLKNLKGSSITEPWGVVSAVHPKPHTGIDYGADTGTPIPSPIDGTVTYSQPEASSGGYGNLVGVTDKNNEQHLFAHMNSLDRQVGETIKKGDIIGPVGSTGHSTGPHLHYEIQDGGVQGKDRDPAGYGLTGLGKQLADSIKGKMEDAAADAPKLPDLNNYKSTSTGKGGPDSSGEYTEVLERVASILTTIANNTGRSPDNRMPDTGKGSNNSSKTRDEMLAGMSNNIGRLALQQQQNASQYQSNTNSNPTTSSSNEGDTIAATMQRIASE